MPTQKKLLLAIAAVIAGALSVEAAPYGYENSDPWSVANNNEAYPYGRQPHHSRSSTSYAHARRHPRILHPASNNLLVDPATVNGEVAYANKPETTGGNADEDGGAPDDASGGSSNYAFFKPKNSDADADGNGSAAKQKGGANSGAAASNSDSDSEASDKSKKNDGDLFPQAGEPYDAHPHKKDTSQGSDSGSAQGSSGSGDGNSNSTNESNSGGNKARDDNSNNNNSGGSNGAAVKNSNTLDSQSAGSDGADSDKAAPSQKHSDAKPVSNSSSNNNNSGDGNKSGSTGGSTGGSNNGDNGSGDSTTTTASGDGSAADERSGGIQEQIRNLLKKKCGKTSLVDAMKALQSGDLAALCGVSST